MLSRMAGRPLKPKAILHLSNPSKARHREEIGQAPSHLPVVPPYLSSSAADIFLNTIELLNAMKVLAVSDTEIIARYSTTLDMLHQAQEQLKDEAEPVREIVDDKTGQMKFTRDCAAFDLFQKCHHMLRQMEAVLGLSPSDRVRLGASRADSQKVGGDPFADLLAS